MQAPAQYTPPGGGALYRDTATPGRSMGRINTIYKK